MAQYVAAIPVPHQNNSTLTISQWYSKHHDIINEFLNELSAKLENACKSHEQNHNTKDVAISVDHESLRSSMIKYLYENSYSRYKSWQ